MTYPRVNLLRKSEQRYQGAVSRRFILVSAVATPILLIAVLSGIKMIQYNGLQSDLEASRDIWTELEPRLALYKEESRGLATNRKALELFEGWDHSKVSFAELLDKVQQRVPADIQFTRLSMRSEPKTSTYSDPSAITLKFDLVLEGFSQGARAENEVIQFRKDLLQSDDLSKVFESVKLVSMRKREKAGNINMREFRMESESLEGGVQ